MANATGRSPGTPCRPDHSPHRNCAGHTLNSRASTGPSTVASLVPRILFTSVYPVRFGSDTALNGADCIQIPSYWPCPRSPTRRRGSSACTSDGVVIPASTMLEIQAAFARSRSSTLLSALTCCMMLGWRIFKANRETITTETL